MNLLRFHLRWRAGDELGFGNAISVLHKLVNVAKRMNLPLISSTPKLLKDGVVRSRLWPSLASKIRNLKPRTGVESASYTLWGPVALVVTHNHELDPSQILCLVQWPIASERKSEAWVSCGKLVREFTVAKNSMFVESRTSSTQ